MGQIFNRIKTIFNSYANSTKKIDIDNIFKDELKEIIDSLGDNLDKKEQNNGNSNEKTNSKKQYQKESVNNPFEKNEVTNAYYTLGIKESASIGEIKSAYKKLIKQYHPDLVQNLNKDEQLKASQKAKEINKAYSILEKIRNF